VGQQDLNHRLYLVLKVWIGRHIHLRISLRHSLPHRADVMAMVAVSAVSPSAGGSIPWPPLEWLSPKKKAGGGKKGDLFRRNAWVVTGTPVTRDLGELRGLCNFLALQPYYSSTSGQEESGFGP
jgi:hypothetical protein